MGLKAGCSLTRPFHALVCGVCVINIFYLSCCIRPDCIMVAVLWASTPAGTTCYTYIEGLVVARRLTKKSLAACSLRFPPLPPHPPLLPFLFFLGPAPPPHLQAMKAPILGLVAAAAVAYAKYTTGAVCPHSSRLINRAMLTGQVRCPRKSLSGRPQAPRHARLRDPKCSVG